MTDSLLNEVDADVRAERMAQLWARTKRPLFFAVIGVIALAAADSIWQYYAEKRGGERMESFAAAHALYEQGKAEEAAKSFATIAGETHGETHTLALLWQGRAELAANQKEAAVASLAAAAGSTPGLWSDLACLRLASLDKTAASTCLSSTRDTPLASQRREWQAADAWASGDREKAIATLEELATSPESSKATSARINQWLATIRAQAPAKAE